MKKITLNPDSDNYSDRLLENDSWRKVIRERVFKDGQLTDTLDPATLFPKSPGIHQKCRRWLGNLLSDDPNERNKALKEDISDIVEDLVQAEQFEILVNEIPNVIADAVTEQGEWNRYQVTKDVINPKNQKKDGETIRPPWVFKWSRGFFDPLLATFTSAHMVKKAMEEFIEEESAQSGDGNHGMHTDKTPKETRLGKWFQDGYKVGTEGLSKDVPMIVLLAILAKALLVTRKCIAGVFKSSDWRIEKNPLYVLLGIALHLFHGIVVFLQRFPEWGRTLFLVTGMLSLFSVFIGLLWWDAILLNHNNTYNGFRVTAFLVVPVSILFIEVLILLSASRSRGR